MEITGINNETVKFAVKLQQKKYRKETGLFLLEGFKAIEEAINSGIKIKTIFKNKASDIEISGDFELILTTEAVLKKISTTDSAPEIVAVGYQKNYDLKDLKQAKKVVLLENIKDYGNLGTILRTSHAFGQEAIVLYGDTTDLYNPKCVRASVGNLWKIPVYQIKDFNKLKELFNGFERIATLPLANDTESLKNFRTKTPYLLMFGSEADGLSDDLKNFATKKLTIEMSNDVESLNLAASAAVILYKFNEEL